MVSTGTSRKPICICKKEIAIQGNDRIGTCFTPQPKVCYVRGKMVDVVRAQPPKLVIENLTVRLTHPSTLRSAVRGGADRLELCANLGHAGGTTPSVGLLQSVKKAVPDVPIMAMVRPRAGDFVYSEGELNVMLQDIRLFKEYGVHGVVFGALTPAGEVDENQVRELVSVAVPLEVCFHRAFDMAIDLKNAWETLSNITGITRVLTSGQRRHASSPKALEALAWMLDSASLTSMGVLPGSGINVSTIPTLCNALLPHGLKEIHLSGGKWIDGRSAYRRDGMGMGEWSVWRTDEEAIRKVRDFGDMLCATGAGKE